MNDLYLPTSLALLGTAIFLDISKHRIPNVLVAALIIAGFATQFSQQAVYGLLGAAGGTVVGMLLLLPFYLVGSMGAGDVKLMGGVGALLGPLQAGEAVLATLIIGALLALLVIAFSRHSRLFFSRYGSMAKTLVTTGQFIYLPRTADDPASQRFAYAAAIALGAVLVLYRHHAFDAWGLS